MKTHIHILAILFLTLFIIPQLAAAEPPLSESQVFEWWDDGLITPNQANEILSQLDLGNYEEACIMAQVYAQESCEVEPPAKKAKTPRKKSRSPKQQGSAKDKRRTSLLNPHANISYRMRLDSTGAYEKSSKSLQFGFYKFSFHLGTIRTLSYHSDGYEAHFGNFSTRELHNSIPLDTLFGTAFTFPIKQFAFSVALDTSKIFGGGAHFNFSENRNMSLQFFHGSDNTLQLQTASELGQISAWWILGQKTPLVKILLGDKSANLSWNIAAYIHGDSLPSTASLGKSIQKSRLWATQAITMALPFKSKLSINTRIINPLHTDSISGRIKISAESGPPLLHGTFYVTCLETAENCDNTDWKIAATSANLPFQFSISSKFRHTPDGFKTPRLEAGATFQNKNGRFQLSVVLPKSSPAKELQIRNQVKVESKFLSLGFSAFFKKTNSSKFAPSHAQLQTNVKF